MSAYGCRFLKTPNFDRVAHEGILFNHCFTATPKCSPSRASLLTGRLLTSIWNSGATNVQQAYNFVSTSGTGIERRPDR